MNVSFIGPSDACKIEEFPYSQIEDWAKREFLKKEASFVSANVISSIKNQKNFYTSILLESGYFIKNSFLLPNYYYGKQLDHYYCFESQAKTYEQLQWDYQDRTQLPPVFDRVEEPFLYQEPATIKDGWISADGMLTPLEEKECHHTIALLIFHQLLSSYPEIESDFTQFVKQEKSRTSDLESYSYVVEFYLQKRLGYWQIRIPGMYRGSPSNGHFIYSKLTECYEPSKEAILYMKQNYEDRYHFENDYYPNMTEEERTASYQFLKTIKNRWKRGTL